MKKLTILLLLTSNLAYSQMRNYNIKVVATHANGTTRTYDVGVFTPPNYDSSKLYHAAFWLHGSGQRGTDINLVYKEGWFKVLKDGAVTDQLAFAPQNAWGGYDGYFPGIVAEIEKRYKIKTMALAGLSGGGGNVWEAILLTNQAFSAKWRAAESLSPSSFNPANVAWLKNTTTKFLSRAGTQSADANYIGNAVNAHNSINALYPGRSRLITNNTMGHGVTNGFINPYKDTVFTNFIAPPKDTATPPVIVPPVVPPSTGLTYAQMLKSFDSLFKLRATPVQDPLLISNDSLVSKKATETQNGYMSKELVNKLNSLELQTSQNKDGLQRISNIVDISIIKQRAQMELIIKALQEAILTNNTIIEALKYLQ